MEENLYPFVKLVAGVLSDRPLFFLINSYTTGLAPSVLDLYFGDPAHQSLRRPHRQRRTGSAGGGERAHPPLRALLTDGRRLGNKEHPMSTMIKAEHLTFSLSR